MSSFKMSRKSKGINAERELVHKFWSSEGWSAVRIAGSGSMRYPSADILAANKSRKIALECKVTKEDKKYFSEEEINQLREFGNIFGAEQYIAVKFKDNDWYFIVLDDLGKSGKLFVVDKELVRLKGLIFDELIK